jgi:uncharacterized membrane protein
MTGTPDKTRLGGWRWLLIPSLLLNLLVLGLVIGIAVRGGPGGGPWRDLDLGLGPVAQALSPEDRRAIRSALFTGDQPIRADRDQRRAEREAMAAALMTEPFDPAAFRAALSAPRARLSQLTERVETALIDRLTAMSAEERRAFAQRVIQALSRDGPRD